MLVSAVRTFYQDCFHKLAGTANILVKDGVVSVSWHPKAGDAVDQVLEHAVSLLRQGDYGTAEPLLRALLAHDANHADALLNLGMMLSDQRNLTEAAALLRRFVDLVPDNSHGWTALGVAAVAALAAIVIILREVWALARLRRIEHIQVDAAHAINTDDTAAAKRAVDNLKALYASRPDAQLGLREMKQYEADILDGRNRVRLAERHLVDWRDGEAHRIIAHAARRITLLTTVAPTAALDILFVAAQNLRMMRELATLYGGRPSTLSTLRLARMVLSHLALTGGIALSDNLIQHVVGRGLLGKLSARFGEGTVNGILTARVGLAARDVCRPIPQETSAKDTLGSLMKELVSAAPQEKEA